MKRRISQRDIAKMLGINVSTVSRALKGLDGVSQALQDEIVRIAEENGYRPNPFAMSLRYDTTRTIGIIMPDYKPMNFSQVVKCIEEEARHAGYMCIVSYSDDSVEGEQECIRQMISMHVEGVLICLSQNTSSFEHLMELQRNHIPTVLFNRVGNLDSLSTVTINNVASAKQATLYLLDHGARRVAFLGGANHLRVVSERKHGYLEALRERGISIEKNLVKCHHLSYNSGLEDVMDLMAMESPPDAILAVGTDLAFAALQVVKSHGKRVPEDVSIIGYTSDMGAKMTVPKLTFIKQNVREMGQKAFRLLHEQLEGSTAVHHVTLSARLEVHDSTR